MAISQNKYVETGSTVVISAPSLPIRGLFIIPAGTSIVSSVTVGSDAPTVVTNADFISGTSIVKDAIAKYFSAKGSTGLSPSDALVIKVATYNETTNPLPYSAALQTAINSGEIFACACPLIVSTVAQTNAELSVDELTAMSNLNTDGNIQFFIPTFDGTNGIIAGTSGWSKFNVTYGGTGEAYQSAATAAMGIVCATDYDQPNSAPTLMYKRVNGISASVTDDTTYGTMTAAKVNFFGLTKTYGASYTFYQEGVNRDGVDTAVEVNDIWLRGTITSGLMTLHMTMPKIPSNAAGMAKVSSIIDSGNDDSAVDAVQNQGYYISTQLVESGEKYTVKYVLIYSKGDAIKKIVGSHVLV